MASPAYAQADSSLVARNKRRGGALSCAECRRLKLKCSRQFPCSNCVKKGVAAICPDSSLTTGKGNRFVLANTEVLHDKINELANRVRQLEDALAQAHSMYSAEAHPLLSEELLKIKRPLERERPEEHSATEDVESKETVETLGTLSISNGGRSTFLGQTANAWYLLQNEEDSGGEEDVLPLGQIIPPDPAWQGSAFPFASVTGATGDGLRQVIIRHLPDVNEAKSKSEIYFKHAAWMYTPITEEDYYNDFYLPVYGDTDGSSLASISGQKLAVLYMVLAIGTLLDLTLPPHSPLAKQRYLLARASFALESVLEEKSIMAIQALLLMCHYMFLADIGEPRWVIMGIIVKLAQSIGLHRDTGRWRGADPVETQKRRELFFELVTYDSWQSLTYGRPPSLSAAHIDGRMPHPTTKSPSGEEEMSFAAWKHRFSHQCLSVVHDQAFGAKTPSYKTILELDRKVKNYYVPPSLRVPGFSGEHGVTVEQPTVQLTMQRYIAFAIKEISMFYMHRGYFAQALEDSPSDPMGSKFSPSVLAAHRSACSFVALIDSLYKQQPGLTERMWFLFTHVFSCAIVLGTLASKPQMKIALSAFRHLESAYNLFFQVSDQNRKAKILPILRSMIERAQANSAAYSQGSLDTSARSPVNRGELQELSTLGGKTRLVERRAPSSPSTSSQAASSPTSSQTAASPSPNQPMYGNMVSPWDHQSPTTNTYGNPPPFSMATTNGYGLYETDTPTPGGYNQYQTSQDSFAYYDATAAAALYTISALNASADGTPPPHDVNERWFNLVNSYEYI
ncbi:hypothetical protein AX16_001379 [Volvariella volvacea WC 439]|nr:hypothetical protein AX16_001379 [Volvariella volvacea WC 439]